MNLETTNHLENIRKAAANLDGVLRKTELIYSDFFSKETGNRIYIKPENLQRTGSFKIRGAYNKVANLTEEERAKGIIASSAGNHAQGVALAASKMGIKATIVMPLVTPLIKVDSTKSYGADVVLHGNIYDEAYGKAVELAEENGYTFVHPYNDYDVMCGQGTIALEILEEMADIDQILVPVGGGGLISGIALAAKAIKPTIQVIGVEPVGAASMTAALDAGRVVTLPQVRTAAEGVAVKTVGENCLAVCSNYVDGIIQVTEEEIMEALLMLLERHKIIAEAAGALPLAAIKKLNTRNKKYRLCCQRRQYRHGYHLVHHQFRFGYPGPHSMLCRRFARHTGPVVKHRPDFERPPRQRHQTGAQPVQSHGPRAKRTVRGYRRNQWTRAYQNGYRRFRSPRL